MRDHQVISYPGAVVVAEAVTRGSADRIAHLYSRKHPERQVHVKRSTAAPAGLPPSAPRVAAATSERPSPFTQGEQQPAPTALTEKSAIAPKAAPAADIAQPYIDETYGTPDDLIAERYRGRIGTSGATYPKTCA